MEDWLRSLVGKCGGVVVREYDQADDQRLGLHHNGWCNGCVTHWLRCKRRGIDFWAWFQTHEAGALTRSVMTRAKMLRAEQPNHPDPACAAAASVLASAGMRLVYSSEDLTLRGRALSLEVSWMQAGGTYNLIAMWGASGGHAMGAVWGDQHVTLFDPNAGEMTFLRSSAAEFFPSFLDGMEYSKKYTGCAVTKFL